MSENENEFSVAPVVPDAVVAPVESPAPVVDPTPVVESAPVAAGPNIPAALAVLKEVDDGLEALGAFPENVIAWLRAKLSEARSHL